MRKRIKEKKQVQKKREARTKSRSNKERPIAVLFADIIGCSETSNHKSLNDYNDFIQTWHSIFNDVIEKHKTAWYEEHEHQYIQASPRGDEGCLMIFIPGRDSLATDVDTAILIALELKRRWLLSEDNQKRIKTGLLPTELAIGIHIGKAYINEETNERGEPSFRPEGYTINLTKRVESFSREGKFTKIFISEAARGELYRLTDERTYNFGPQCLFQPKGISRDIIVFEIKHHFLPSDWNDTSQNGFSKSRIVLFETSQTDINLVRRAHETNPTNLWLAEEFIIQLMSYQYKELERKGHESNNKKIKTAFKEPLQIAQRMSTGDLRDAGILTICGLIVGEYGDFKDEQNFYRDAIKLNPINSDPHWYLGQSMSYQIFEELKITGGKETRYEELASDKKDQINEIFKLYEKAIELRPSSSWVHFDLACELIRWGKEKKAIEKLEHAVSLNPNVHFYIEDEPYLQSIKNHERVKKLFKPET